MSKTNEASKVCKIALLVRFSESIKQCGVDTLLRPPVENFVKIFYSRSLKGNTGVICRLNQGLHDRRQPTSKRRRIAGQATGLVLGHEEPNFSSKLKQGFLEVRRRFRRLSHDGRLQGRECKLCAGTVRPIRNTGAKTGSNVIERQPPSRRDNCKIPENVPKFLDHGLGISNIRGAITLLFLNLAQKAAGLTKQAEERKRK